MGLRQGDPLSLYLFILGAEVLIRLIKLEQGLGKLTGFPIEGGSLSHLFYADDSLLMATSLSEEAGVMKNLLEEYCFLSGQKVNLTKSSIIFGSDVQVRHWLRTK